MAPAAAAPSESPTSSALPMTTNMTATSLTSGGNSCLDEQIERLKRCEYLREGEVKALCLRAREILVDESNVQRVDAPVTVRIATIVVVGGHGPSNPTGGGGRSLAVLKDDEMTIVVKSFQASEPLIYQYVVPIQVCPHFFSPWS